MSAGEAPRDASRLRTKIAFEGRTPGGGIPRNLGRFRAQHAFLVSQLLANLDYLEEAIDGPSAQIDVAIALFTWAHGSVETRVPAAV